MVTILIVNCQFGDPATFYAITFFKELIDIVKEKHLIFRVVQGTRSHDLNQLQIFKPYEQDLDIDFKIIENVTEENILGMNVLFVPEEYPENSDEYYAPFKQKYYNIMFVHGTFDFVAQPGQIELSKKSVHTAPVFIWKEWKEALRDGFVSAGHIHGRNVYGRKIYYSGSFSRWNYGERSDKGFTYFEYDLENNNYTVEFIDNTMAPKYEVFSVKELEIDLDNTDTDTIKTLLNEQITEGNNLRIDLSGLSKDKIEVLKKAYSGNPNVKIEVRDEKKQVIRESAESMEKYKKYHYITKRQLPLNKTIQRFCKEELNKDLAVDAIDKILISD